MHAKYHICLVFFVDKGIMDEDDLRIVDEDWSSE